MSSLILCYLCTRRNLTNNIYLTLNMDMKKAILSAASVLSASPVGDVAERDSSAEINEQEGIWKEVLDRYGNPDVVVVVDASRGNEPAGVVLIYDAGGLDNEGFLVYDGMCVDKKNVIDVTFNNAAVPYVANAYQVVINAKGEGERMIRIQVGNDLIWAREVCEEIKRNILI